MGVGVTVVVGVADASVVSTGDGDSVGVADGDGDVVVAAPGSVGGGVSVGEGVADGTDSSGVGEESVGGGVVVSVGDWSVPESDGPLDGGDGFCSTNDPRTPDSADPSGVIERIGKPATLTAAITMAMTSAIAMMSFIADSRL